MIDLAEKKSLFQINAKTITEEEEIQTNLIQLGDFYYDYYFSLLSSTFCVLMFRIIARMYLMKLLQ